MPSGPGDLFGLRAFNFINSVQLLVPFIVFYLMLYLVKDCHAIYIRLQTPDSMRSSGLVR